ncbi:hypothetical protein [Sphingobacterium thalpophilum]|uniref:hypothetical protein n=1 Tax=Sphingobacterium thalpophilum TaxID=259 RepID=UPI003C74F2BA
MEKVQRFSDVPWVDKALEVSDANYLFAKRDPRATVVQKIWRILSLLPNMYNPG